MHDEYQPFKLVKGYCGGSSRCLFWQMSVLNLLCYCFCRVQGSFLQQKWSLCIGIHGWSLSSSKRFLSFKPGNALSTLAHQRLDGLYISKFMEILLIKIKIMEIITGLSYISILWCDAVDYVSSQLAVSFLFLLLCNIGYDIVPLRNFNTKVLESLADWILVFHWLHDQLYEYAKKLLTKIVSGPRWVSQEFWWFVEISSGR